MDKLYRTAVEALGSLASFAEPGQQIRYPHRSDVDALRSDWMRIGGDMRTVMEREDGQVSKAERRDRHPSA